MSETPQGTAKHQACEQYVRSCINSLAPDSKLRKEPLLTVFIGNLRNAWYEGSKYKPDPEGYTVEELSKFSENRNS